MEPIDDVDVKRVTLGVCVNALSLSMIGLETNLHSCDGRAWECAPSEDSTSKMEKVLRQR